uniref:Ig-like domain-containing protein n=1 Tax=Sarcophilus harrisii TaxID=9305 RepID=A0A7N4PAU7_SARHA
MSPAFPALLCLGLCLGHRMKAQADKLPRPSLRAENGSLGPLGRSVTLRCRGSPGAAEYFLEKYQGSRYERIDSKLSQEDEVEFPISSMSLSDTGTYSCHYRTEYYWSERSEPLELVATDRYDAPSLSAQPNSTVAEGQAVTLWCCSGNRYDRSALYKDGEQVTKARAQLLNEGAQANFSIPAVTSAHGGTYRCYSFQRLSPHEWSFPSDPLELRVTGTSKDPSLPPSPGGTQALTPSPPSEELAQATARRGHSGIMGASNLPSGQTAEIMSTHAHFTDEKVRTREGRLLSNIPHAESLGRAGAHARGSPQASPAQPLTLTLPHPQRQTLGALETRT